MEMQEPLVISQAIYDEIVAHARAGKPEEICGVLRGHGNRAFELIRAQNVAADKIDNYEVDPQTLLLQFKFEEAGERMVSIYHSHPVSVAYPSATDAWSAHYPDAYYLICSLEFDDAPDLRAFRLLPDFFDLDMDLLRQRLPFYETRPGLFGYYQAEEAPVPAELAEVAEDLAPPFYVVFQADESQAVDDFRVVAVRERPVEIAVQVEF
jgi:[CysO sulfur-carrier protein]-S-L-cysteine hydrolase